MLLETYKDSNVFGQVRGLQTLGDAILGATQICVRAGVVKVEALLVQAAKSKVKKNQKDIISAQFQELAGSDEIDESMIHPTLISFGRSFLE